MSDQQSQSPSQARREAARARGIVVQSPLITTAAGLLAFVAAGFMAGPSLFSAALNAVRAAILGSAEWSNIGPTALGWQARPSWGLIASILTMVCSAFVACVVVHVVQTRGLWAVSRLSFDWSRLWQWRDSEGTPDEDSRFGERLARGVEQGFRTIVLAAVLGGVLACEHARLSALLNGGVGELIIGGAEILMRLFAALGAALLGLGGLEFWLQHRRMERQLSMTPDQSRQEQKAIEGDPAVRSRRTQLAREWLRDPGELLAGASIVLTGSAGLTVLLAGSPPPGRITVRTIARGIAASSLRHGAERAGIPVVRSDDLTRWFASSRTRARALPADYAQRLARLWAPRHARRESV